MPEVLPAAPDALAWPTSPASSVLHDEDRLWADVPPLQAVDFDPFADPVTRVLPLTVGQRELLAAAQMGAEVHCAFNLAYALHLRGPLSMASMCAALQQVVDRHGGLRAAIAPDGSGQRIARVLPVELPLLDLSDEPAERQQTSLAFVFHQETHTPFDLNDAGLWRARVVRLAADRHVLVLTVHHLFSDGWSSSVLFGDLAAAYAADRFGLAPQLPPAMDYAGYVLRCAGSEWQTAERRAREYWRRQHTPAAPPSALPLDHPRPPMKTLACGHMAVRVDAALTAAVRTLGARQGCTLFVTLLAVHHGLLARLSGSEDLVVGVPMADQTLIDNPHGIADGVYTVPLRLSAELEQPFRSWLPQVRRAFLDAQAHQQLSLGTLLQELRLPRDPSRTPLVNLLFNIDRIASPLDFGELKVERVETPKDFSNSEWSLNIVDDGHELLVECHYLTALVDGSTVRRWLHTYVEALRQLAADPELPLVAALMPTPAEQALVASFDGAQLPLPSLRVEAVVAERAAMQPDAPAIWHDGRTTSYAELDAHANGVADRLLRDGVQAGERVGIGHLHGAEAVVAVLGVLKAGALAVPMAADDPAKGWVAAAADARLQRVLGSFEASGGAAQGWRRLDVADCAPQALPPSRMGTPPDAAGWIFHTDGGGRAAGVVIGHRGLLNLAAGLARETGIGAGDRLASSARLSSIETWADLVLTLTQGGCLVMLWPDGLPPEPGHVRVPGGAVGGTGRYTDSQRITPANAQTGLRGVPQAGMLTENPRDKPSDILELGRRLDALLRAGEATAWHASAQAFEAWCAAVPERRPGLRGLIDGEGLSLPVAQAAAARCGGGAWALHGWPETTGPALAWAIPPEAKALRIGRPLVNVQVKVRDAQGRALPLGAAGELWVSGEGVALGYPGHSDRACGRFVAGSAAGDPVFVRTGVRGRWHADGSLQSLGSGWPGEADERPPTTPHRPEEARDMSPAEQTVAAIWCRLLQIEGVHPQDNFFDLGGHSLLAAQASVEIEAALGFEVGVPRLVMESLSQVARPSTGTVPTDDACDWDDPASRLTPPVPDLPAPALRRGFWRRLLGRGARGERPHD